MSILSTNFIISLVIKYLTVYIFTNATSTLCILQSLCKLNRNRIRLFDTAWHIRQWIYAFIYIRHNTNLFPNIPETYFSPIDSPFPDSESGGDRLYNNQLILVETNCQFPIGYRNNRFLVCFFSVLFLSVLLIWFLIYSHQTAESKSTTVIMETARDEKEIIQNDIYRRR